MDTYVYQIDNNLYINLTNQCSNDCGFCVRNLGAEYEGHNLSLQTEPTAKQVTDLIGDPKRYDQVVLCGYGEPLIKLNQVLEICKYVKQNGGKVRINTNGQANLIHGKDITPLLVDVDSVNISLNNSTAAEYQKTCRSIYGEKAFYEIQEFAVKCKEVIPDVVLSVVDVIGQQQINECQTIADKLGVKLRVRKLII